MRPAGLSLAMPVIFDLWSVIWEMGFFLEPILLFTVILGLFTCEFVICEPIFRVSISCIRITRSNCTVLDRFHESGISFQTFYQFSLSSIHLKVILSMARVKILICAYMWLIVTKSWTPTIKILSWHQSRLCNKEKPFQKRSLWMK